MVSLAGKFIRCKSIQQFGVTTVVLVAIGLITYGSYGLWQRHATTHNPHPAVTKGIITNTTGHPDETKPTDACASYKVAAAHPQRINLPSLKTSGCIEQVGIDQHGAISVPDNIYTAAWYVQSALPGQPGLSIIDGHISGRYNANGIFQHIAELKSSDNFSIILGNGGVLRYQVYQEQSVPLSQAMHVLLTQDKNVASQLNLITCGGQYDKSTKLYDHRIIVSARLL